MCPVFSGRMSGHRVRHRGSFHSSFDFYLAFQYFRARCQDIVSDIVDPAASMLHLTFYLDLCIVQQLQYFRAGCQDIVSDIVDPAASILHLTFYLALCIVQPDLIP